MNHVNTRDGQSQPSANRPKRVGRYNARKRRRRLPPGQRLIVYGFLACLITLTQAMRLPADEPETSLVNTLSPAIGALAVSSAPPFSLTTRLDEVSNHLKETADLPKITAGVFAVDLKSGNFAELNGYQKFPAASIIKVPVLIALLSAIDKHLVDFNQQLEIRKDLVGGGSGILQWRPVGSKISLKDTAELMITRSDNTATNMVIDLLGGIGKFNPLFKQWGLSETKLNDWLPDLGGQNKTSPYELAYLIGRVNNGDILSKESRTWMFTTMEHVRTKSLLPPGLGPGAKISHKTGDIGSMVGDAGIVWCANGTCYLVAVQVGRPHNDHRANLLVRKLSKLVYEGFTGEIVPEPPKTTYVPRVRRHRSIKHATLSHGKHYRHRGTTRSVRTKVG